MWGKRKRDRVGTHTTSAEQPVYIAISVSGRFGRGIHIDVLADRRSVTEWKRDQDERGGVTQVRAVYPEIIRPWYRDQDVEEF